MRRLSGWIVFLAMLPALIALHVSSHAQAATKKTTTSKKKSAAPAKSSTSKSASSKTASSKKGKKSSRSSTTWRNRQLAPTPDRYREIQSALAAQGYLQADEVTGTWNAASVDALRRFQAAEKIDGAGKINSLSLIALGLGPKYEARNVPSPPPPSTSTPAQ